MLHARERLGEALESLAGGTGLIRVEEEQDHVRVLSEPAVAEVVAAQVVAVVAVVVVALVLVLVVVAVVVAFVTPEQDHV